MASKKKLMTILIIEILGISAIGFGLTEEYIQVPALIDLRTDSSDGAHTLEYLLKLAKKRGFSALFISDHHLQRLEYGIRPFQNILKKKVEKPGLRKEGTKNYLKKIELFSRKYPDVILIAGTESAPFYYWKGSYFKKDLTVCDWEKHLLIFGLEEPEDYEKLPVLHNGYSIKHIFSLIGISHLFLLLLVFFGLYFLKGKGIVKYSGMIILVFSLLLLLNNHPFKSSPYSQYHGFQGISPYQLVIDYVNSKGGMVFWNHPQTLSGRGRIGPISKNTPPYPEVLLESKNYTGFAALYGDTITITEPNNIWDRVLKEYCQGQREKPVWGISAADFHQEGGASDKLGNYPTIFLVKDKTKEDILNALKKGRMYASSGDIDLPRLILEDFSISDSESSRKGIQGEEVLSRGFPRIKIRVSDSCPGKNSLSLRLIRSGKLLQTFKGESPLYIEFQDDFMEKGKKIYYRLDVEDEKGRKLVSNPIFVRFE